MGPLHATRASVNNCPFWRLRGKLNIGALEDALALVVQRHEVLHARYTMRHGEMLQVSNANSQWAVLVSCAFVGGRQAGNAAPVIHEGMGKISGGQL